MSATFEQEVLQQLRKHGSDVSKPHEFEFYLYLPSQALANEAGDKIRQSGFSGADVDRSASGSAWLCVAKKTLIPATANLADHARFLEEVAAALDGEFDGWEAEIV